MCDKIIGEIADSLNLGAILQENLSMKWENI